MRISHYVVFVFTGDVRTRRVRSLFHDTCAVVTKYRVHTFCKRLVNAGMPIQNVARLVGHDSIQTTMRYVEPSQDELRQAMQDVR